MKKTIAKFYLIDDKGNKEVFEGMPDGAYAAEGSNGAVKGSLFKMTFPCTLTPLFNEDGTHAITTEKRAGKSYSKRNKTWRNE